MRRFFFGSARPPAWARRFSTRKPPEPQGETPPTGRPYFDLSKYKTIFGKARASLRFSLNRFQPWTADHRLAIASWMAIGTTWWIVAGTSTFLSVVIFVLPAERTQEHIARKVSNYVTQYTGAEISFASAIQPTWKTLRFTDVRIRRTEAMCGIKDSMEIDVSIDQLDIKVSLLWLLEGKGIVEKAYVRGVRGVMDRRNCWNEYDENGELIPFSAHVPVDFDKRWRSEWYKGSFDLRECQVYDVEIKLLQPEPRRALRCVIHSLHSNRLRRQFLAYDLLCSTIDGSLDYRLFSLRPPADLQIEGFTVSHFTMNGMDVDIAKAGGATGPLSWMTRGRIDVNAMFYFPKDYAGQETDQKVRIKVDMNLNHLTASIPMGDDQISYLNAALIQPMGKSDFNCHFFVHLFVILISFLKVIYLNTNYISIPLSAWLAIPVRYYNGAWSPYAACMTDALSEAVGVELSHRVADQKRPKNVLWMLIKGVDGVWRAGKHALYIFWHGYVYQ